jgi:hypothetical protein
LYLGGLQVDSAGDFLIIMFPVSGRKYGKVSSIFGKDMASEVFKKKISTTWYQAGIV